MGLEGWDSDDGDGDLGEEGEGVAVRGEVEARGMVEVTRSVPKCWVCEEIGEATGAALGRDELFEAALR